MLSCEDVEHSLADIAALHLWVCPLGSLSDFDEADPSEVWDFVQTREFKFLLFALSTGIGNEQSEA
jgi:hypothetical protein